MSEYVSPVEEAREKKKQAGVTNMKQQGVNRY